MEYAKLSGKVGDVTGDGFSMACILCPPRINSSNLDSHTLGQGQGHLIVARKFSSPRGEGG